MLQSLATQYLTTECSIFFLSVWYTLLVEGKVKKLSKK